MNQNKACLILENEVSHPLFTHSMKTLSRSSMYKTVAMLPTKNTLTKCTTCKRVFLRYIHLSYSDLDNEWSTGLQKIAPDYAGHIYCGVVYCAILRDFL